MKLKDITESSALWSTTTGALQARPDVAAMEDTSAQSKYPVTCTKRVLEFLKRNHGRTLREVMDAEIDISDVIQ